MAKIGGKSCKVSKKKPKVKYPKHFSLAIHVKIGSNGVKDRLRRTTARALAAHAGCDIPHELEL